MLYRSAHIYILLTSLLNLVLGLYLVEPASGWRRVASRLGSLLILIAPLMQLIGFALESTRTDFERPFGVLSIYGFALGVVLQTVARLNAGRTADTTALPPTVY